jgi:hypothetical protein
MLKFDCVNVNDVAIALHSSTDTDDHLQRHYMIISSAGSNSLVRITPRFNHLTVAITN